MVGTAVVANYSFGVPDSWDGDAAVTFESQAEFLKRHGLLTACEKDRADFTPETINYSRHTPFGAAV
jgi:hypothetical protein